MRKDYKERLLVIGCVDVGRVISQINTLVASSNQGFDVIFDSLEAMARQDFMKKPPLLDFDSLIPKDNPIVRRPFKGYHNSKRKQLRK